MYEKVFHFSSRPFTATPYVKHYFSGDSIQQALSQARICVDRASGPVMAIGAAGTGKSLLLAMLEDQYQSRFTVVNLACAKLDTRQDLLQSILFELKQPFQGLTDSELRFALIEYLSPNEQCPNGILLLIDEAHLLSAEMLDEVRLITNFIRDGQPRVRLVMAGNHRLEENLGEPKLESFNQRIAARCYLNNMNQEETTRYVIEHIDRADGEGCLLFDDASLMAIYEVSDGCPRLVNQVCDHALILAATRGELVITENCISEAWSDVQSIPGDWAAPASQPDSLSKIKDDDSWTVLEFGQLDDSDEQSDEGTIYEFANPEPESGEIQNDDCDEQSGELAGAPESLESDFASTGQNTPINQSEVLADEFQPAQDDSVPVEDTDNSVNEDAVESVDSISNDNDDLESQLKSVFGEGLGSAQLNTVFGEESGSTDFSQNQEVEDLEDLEAEQIELLDQVESATSDVDSIGFDPSVSEQLAAAISGFTADQSEDDSSDSLSNESELGLGHDVGLENVESEQSSPPFQDGQDWESDPFSQGDEPSEPHADAEEYFPTPTFQDDDLSESFADNEEHHPAHLDSQLPTYDSNLESDEFVAESNVNPSEITEFDEPEQVVETDDPFAEEFAEEEHLFDRFAPFVAQQNQSSLTVTSSDLEMIRPLDLNVEMEAVANSDDSAIEDVDHVESDISSLSQAELETRETVETAVFTAPDCPIEQTDAVDDSPAFGSSESSDSDSKYDAPGVYIIEAEQSDDVEAIAVESEQPNPDNDPAVTSARSVLPTSMMEPVDGESEYRSHDAELSEADIERQTNEALKRLGIPQDVSCETGRPDTVMLDSADPPDDAAPPQKPAGVPRVSVQTIPLNTIPRPSTQTEILSEPPESSGVDQPDLSLDEVQQIMAQRETGRSDTVMLDSADPPDDAAPPQKPAGVPRVSVQTIPLNTIPRPSTQTEILGEPPEFSGVDQPDLSLGEVQRIMAQRETGQSNTVIIDSADPPDDAAPPQKPVGVPRAIVQTISLNTAPRPLTQTTISEEPADASVFDRQDLSLDENQKIMTTGETETADSVELDSPEETAPPQVPVGVPRTIVQTIPLGTTSRPLTRTTISGEPADASDFDRQNAALDETQQILNEILAQKNLLANQELPSRNLEATQISDPDTGNLNAGQDEARLDDQEMIIVNKMDEQSNSAPDKETPMALPTTPISKGRAERMDYQKLFDQLRDISNSEK